MTRTPLLLLAALALTGCRALSGLDEARPYGTPGAPCGADGAGVLNEALACTGPDMQLSAYDDATCAQMHDGKVWCWGCMQTLDDVFFKEPVPRRIEGMPPALYTSVGQAHACSVVEGGEIYCWGWNLAGQLGTTPSDETARTPTKIPGFEGLVFKEVHCGWGHSCALTVDGEVYCWGANFNEDLEPVGQCGVDPTAPEDRIVEPKKTPVIKEVVTLATMKHHNCVLRAADQNFLCWGSNAHGQLAVDPSELPATHEPRLVDLAAYSVVLGFESSYAVPANVDEPLFAWGKNTGDQLGVGPDGPDQTYEPAEVQLAADGGSTVPLYGSVMYRTNGSHMCARLRNPAAEDHPFVCWGTEQYGELGVGEEIGSSAAAVPATTIPASSRELVLGSDHGCALVPPSGEDGWTVRCWGRHDAVGDGSATTCRAEQNPAEPRYEAQPVLWE